MTLEMTRSNLFILQMKELKLKNVKWLVQVTCLVSDKTMLQSYLLTISLVLLPPHDSTCLGNFSGAAIFVIVVPDSLVPGTLISIKGEEPFLGSQVHKSIT